MVRGILCDVHGVLYVHPDGVPQSAEAVAAIKSSGLPFCFLTNSTQFPKGQILTDLTRVGIDLEPHQLLTSPQAAAQVMAARGIGRVGWLCSRELCEDFPGLTFVDPESSPQAVDAVLVGDIGERFTYRVLNQAFRWIHEGAVLIALARNRFYQAQDGLVLDSGPYVKLLEEATGVEAQVMGKPSPEFFAAGLRQLGVSAEQAVMVGDDLDFDVLPAMAMGMQGVLVQTGKFRSKTYATAPLQPTHLAKNLLDAVQRGYLR